MDKSWLTEFTVTPHVTHAVAALRAAIPRRGDIEPGGEGLYVKRVAGELEALSSRVELAEIDEEEPLAYQTFTLNDEQTAAAIFLLSLAAFYNALIEQAYLAPDETAAKAYSDAVVTPGAELPDGLYTAKDRLSENVLRKLNTRFYVLAVAGEDSLTVYS